jgi:hypothetical protein
MSSFHAYYFECPWCGTEIQVLVDDIRCKRFVCGVDKSSGLPVNPHMSANEANQMRVANTAWGCLNPFYFNGKESPSRREYG